MEAREWNHVHCQLAEVGIQLTGETETGGHSGHGHADQVVQIAVGRSGKLQRAETCKWIRQD